MRKLLIRLLIWLLYLLGVTVEFQHSASGQRKVIMPAKRKCTIRIYRAGEKEIRSHSICDGKLLLPQDARMKLGVAKLTETREEVHYIG